MLTACDKDLFAEGAYYSFPRGKSVVSGPSIKMAREAARIYGNYRYGFFITHDDDDARAITAWAWDCEKNNRMSASDFFKKLVQRRTGDVTNWVTPDERDLRELTFRRASILIRNCILALLPGYFVDNAVAVCKATVAGGAKSDLKERVSKMLTAFEELGISEDQLTNYLGKPVGACSREQLSELRGIIESIREGVISPQERTEMFGVPEAKGRPQPSDEKRSSVSEGDMRSAENLKDPSKKATDSQPEPEQPQPERKKITEGQRKKLFAGLNKSGKTEKDLKAYLKKNHGLESTKELTQDEYDDLLGFASFVPPKDPPPPSKKTATKSNGDDAPTTDPKLAALDLIKKMTSKATFDKLRPEVIALCNKIKGS